MPEEITEEQQQALDQISQVIASQLAEGKKKEKIVKGLVKQGLSSEIANALVIKVEIALEQARQQYLDSPEGRKKLANKHLRQMIFGVLWAVGGTLVTVFTYQAASSGGYYFIAWGAIIFGIVDIFRGLFGWLKYKS